MKHLPLGGQDVPRSQLSCEESRIIRDSGHDLDEMHRAADRLDHHIGYGER